MSVSPLFSIERYTHTEASTSGFRRSPGPPLLPSIRQCTQYRTGGLPGSAKRLAPGMVLIHCFFHAILLSAQHDTEQKLAPAQQWRPVALSEALVTLHQVISATVVLCWRIILTVHNWSDRGALVRN